MKLRRLLLKLSIFAVIAACVAPFFINDKNGSPLLSVDKIELPAISLPQFNFFSKKSHVQEESSSRTNHDLIEVSNQVREQNTVIIYTYKDEMGVSHYTNKKPFGVDYKVIHMPTTSQDDEIFIKKVKDKIDDVYQKIKQNQILEPSSIKQKSKNLSLPKSYLNPHEVIKKAEKAKDKLVENYQHKEDILKELND